MRELNLRGDASTRKTLKHKVYIVNHTGAARQVNESLPSSGKSVEIKFSRVQLAGVPARGSKTSEISRER